MKKINIQDFSILLIEPSATQRKIIANKLMLAKVKRVDVVATNNEAFDFINADICVPDLIITAMHVGNVTGPELIKEIRSNERFNDVPFLLITSDCDSDRLKVARETGVVAILPKPFELDDLQEALECTVEYHNHDELDFDYYEVDQLKVLIVDDSDLAIRYMKIFLFNMGFNHIYEVESGAAALTLLKKEKIDVVFTDYEMPDMTGCELAAKIKYDLEYADLPIILTTSSIEKVTASGANLDDFADVFAKPFHPNKFRNSIKNALE